MTTLWRIFKTGFRNLFRNAWLSTAATAIMVVTLVIVTFFAFSAMFLHNQLTAVKEKIDLAIFLQDEITPDQIKELQAKLSALNNVKSVTYISKADALKRFSSISKDSKNLTDKVPDIGNPLPASLEVKTKDASQLSEINQIIKASDFSKVIKSTSYDDSDTRKKIYDKIIKISNGVARTGTIISVAFLIISLLIIFNTIRMAIFTRREEIEIMKLVGATNWFIRGPFIIEGSLYGVLGATISVLISIPIIRWMGPFFVSYFNAPEVITFFSQRILLVVAAEFGLGIIIGVLSSWLAISRYLKL